MANYERKIGEPIGRQIAGQPRQQEWDWNLRQHCLGLAVQAYGSSLGAEAMVKSALQFEAFVRGPKDDGDE